MPGGPDVFLSYNTADRAAVEAVAEQLRGERIEAWLDRWSVSHGGRWQEEVAEGLAQAKACAVFIGAAGLGDWAREELGVAQNRAAKDRGFRLFMVLLPGAPDPLDPSLAFLRTRSWVDLRGGVAHPDGIQDLIGAITGVPSPRDTPAETGVCPYRGLEAFEEEHAEFFFGRRDDVKVVVEKLRRTRFVGVLGPSGSGKSSLVRAGVIPVLRAGGLPGSDAWAVRVFSPGAQPLDMLAAQVSRLWPDRSMQHTLDQLGADRRTLDLGATLALAERPGDERVLLVVDQFEELFTLCADEAQRGPFLANLLHAATIPGGRVVVVIGLRADFYHRCADYPELASLLSAEQFLVGPLDAEGLRQAIEEPARQVGLELEPGLVETILDDVANRPGTLPLLEHVLFELWEDRRGRMLTLEAYVANGGVEGALAGRADAIYGALSPAQQDVARRVLLRLVQPGEGAADTRRQATVAELVARPDQQPDVEVVVRALADQRLVTTGRDQLSGAQVVDITHEALIRGWPRLRGWINEDREALRAHRRLTEAATEWDQQGRDDGLLLGGSRLAYWQERDTAELNETELAFLGAGRRRQARERAAGRRRVRVAVGALATAVAVISAVAVVALQQSQRAGQRAEIALSRQLAANARAALPTDPELGLLLAREAYRTEPTTDEAASVLRQATQESRVRTAYRGHVGTVNDGTFSPDGRLLASAGDDGTVRVWDREAQAPPVVLRGHNGPARTAAFSPDGARMVSSGADHTVRIWDRTGAGVPVILRGHQGPVSTAAFSPDGGRIASASADGTVRVWDAQARGEPTELRGHEGTVWSASFSADGRLLVSAGQDGTVRVWDLAGGSGPVVVGTHADGDGTSLAALSAAFSPDGRRVVSGGGDGKGRVWDWAGEERPRELESHFGDVTDVSFSPDGRLIVGAGADWSVLVWESAGVTEAPMLGLRGHGAPLHSAAFSPDGRMVLSTGEDGTLRLWELGVSVLDARGAPVNHAALSPDGRRVVTAASDGVVRLWDLASDAEPVVVGRHEHSADHASFSLDGRRVLSSTFDSTAIWDLAGKDEPVVLRPGAWRNRTAAFSPDGRRVVTGGSEGELARVWEVGGRRESVALPGEDLLKSAAFSPDGRVIAIGGVDGTVRMWEWASNQAPRELRGHEGRVLSVTFSPDGGLVLSAGEDRTVRLWDQAGTRPPIVLRGHPGKVRSASFSPDGRSVLSADDDGSLRVWDWAGQTQPLLLPDFVTEPRSAAFVPPDGRRVFGVRSNRMYMWACDACRPVEEVFTLSGQRVTRALTSEESARFLHGAPGR